PTTPAPAPTGGGSAAPAVVAYAYVGGAGPAIFGYALRADNSLAALPNSPYSGASISVVSNGAAVFALRNGTNAADSNLVSFARASDGSLRLNSDTPVSAHTGLPGGSGGTTLSLDHTGQFLYVGDVSGSGDNQYGVYN